MKFLDGLKVVLFCTLPVVMASTIIAARVHHLFVRPDLTEAQAVWFYWPFWAIAIGCVAVLGWVVTPFMRGKQW